MLISHDSSPDYIGRTHRENERDDETYFGIEISMNCVSLQVISIDLRTNLLEGVGVKPRESGTAPERPGKVHYMCHSIVRLSSFYGQYLLKKLPAAYRRFYCNKRFRFGTAGLVLNQAQVQLSIINTHFKKVRGEYPNENKKAFQ